jgi:hypothetical protein
LASRFEKPVLGSIAFSWLLFWQTADTAATATLE